MHSEKTTTNPHGIRTVFILCAVLLFVLPPYVVFMGRPSPVRSMETICMQTSLETWLRAEAGEPMAWWNPTWDGGVIRIEKPPLLVWLNLLAWSGHTPETVTMEQLAFGSRLMTILVVLIGLASVFWIGVQLRNRNTGLLAALATGSTFLLIKQTHYATYDAQLMGWATLAVALGVRAVYERNPEERAVWSWFFWGLAGIALGATLMTKGPVGAVWVLAPLATAIALLSRRPVRDAAGLCLAVVIGTLILLPWTLHTLDLQSLALSSLADEYKPVDTDQFRPLYYYAGIVAFVFPWTFWWIGSLIHPFRRKEGGRARFFPLIWFLLPFLFVSAWPMRNARYLVPSLPSAGLMCAVYLDQVLHEVSFQKNPARLLRIFWVIAILISFLVSVLILLQPWLMAQGVLDEPYIEGISTLGSLFGLALLLLICSAGIRFSAVPLRPMSFLLVGVWMVTLGTFGYYGYSLAGHQAYPWQAQAEQFAQITGDAPAYFLYEADRENPPKPEMGFAIYSFKIIRPVTTDHLEELRRENPAFFLLVSEDSTRITPQSEGWKWLGPFEDDDFRWNLFTVRAP
ncbi:MAG: phospholipid carrier-dependent glycosyltransferase [Kiritimatiellae bacterium]|nr:phospholipid carrier-dependent glycosyltransferase [Kiritimatiellia bacterium]